MIYRYEVINNSTSAIDAVTLGVPSPGKEIPEVPWTGIAGMSDVPTEVSAAYCKPASRLPDEALHPHDVIAILNEDTRTIQVKRNKGRVYYLTYRAIDGSGNSSTLTITVPGELAQ